MQMLRSLWLFIQDQVLGMKWLNALIGDLLSLLGLDTASRLGGSVQFFVYDVVKITVLLCFLIFLISYIQSYFPPERSRRILGRFHGIGANIISALLGTVTPFCSCSSIPLFIGFTSAGLPLGVTFSFLISSPMVDLGSLILLMSIFGAKVAIIYVIVGLVIAVAGGTLIKKLRMEPQRRRRGHRIPRTDQTGTGPVCQRTGRFDIQESISLHPGRCGHRRGHSQLAPGKLDRSGARRQQPVRGRPRHAGRYPHVRRYFWHHPGGGGPDL